MKLIMTCQTMEGRDFAKDIRFSIVAAAFWKRVYPSGRAFVATNEPKLVPAKYRSHTEIIKFTSDKPLALARTEFMADYLGSSLMRDSAPTVFAGHDVLFLRELPEFQAKAVTNYRFHPSQPYCSDLFIAYDRDYSADIIREVAFTQSWMPQPIVNGAGDQLAYALIFGMPDTFDGLVFPTPRKPDVLAVPANQILFTPNDYFPPKREDFGKLTPNPTNEELMETKIALHFKGNRKDDFFKFAKWAHDMNYVDLSMMEDL